MWSSVAVVGALLTLIQPTPGADTGQQRQAYQIPWEGQQLTFNCSHEGAQSYLWILPDATVLPVDTPPVDSNYRFGNHDELIIGAVKSGMDGKYVCVLKTDDGATLQMHFMIPYIVTRADYTYSFVISLSVSLVFAGACIIILLVDKYRWRVEEQRLRKRTRTARKSRVSEMEHSAGASSSTGAVGQTNPAFSNDVSPSTSASLTTGL